MTPVSSNYYYLLETTNSYYSLLTARQAHAYGDPRDWAKHITGRPVMQATLTLVIVLTLTLTLTQPSPGGAARRALGAADVPQQALGRPAAPHGQLPLTLTLTLTLNLRP